MPEPVVITRPLAQARQLAEQLSALGRQGIVFPLLEILPLEDDAQLRLALADLGRYAMVAFVSPNAIEAALPYVSDWPPHVAMAVMGEGSRGALARHGFDDSNAAIISPRDPARTDSQTLLQALELDKLRGKQVLVVRGESGRELLADTLRREGIQVTQVAAYRRIAPELNEARRMQFKTLIEAHNVWILTSSEAVRILNQQAGQVAGAEGLVKMRQKKILVPHERIAETAHMHGFHNIILTGSGDEQLLAALQCRI